MIPFHGTTVNDLIEKLQKVKNKDKEVFLCVGDQAIKNFDVEIGNYDLVMLVERESISIFK